MFVTGIDEVRKKLEEMGLNKSQVNSKAVVATFDIMLGAQGQFYELDRELDRLALEKKAIEGEIRNLRLEIERLEKACRETSIANEADVEYIKEFNQSLLSTESERGRDIMRTAQLFVNTVERNTDYDNYAFIVGLGAILSGESVGQLNALRKVNSERSEGVRKAGRRL